MREITLQHFKKVFLTGILFSISITAVAQSRIFLDTSPSQNQYPEQGVRQFNGHAMQPRYPVNPYNEQNNGQPTAPRMQPKPPTSQYGGQNVRQPNGNFTGGQPGTMQTPPSSINGKNVPASPMASITKEELFEALKQQYFARGDLSSGVDREKVTIILGNILSRDYDVHCGSGPFPENYGIAGTILSAMDSVARAQNGDGESDHRTIVGYMNSVRGNCEYIEDSDQVEAFLNEFMAKLEEWRQIKVRAQEQEQQERAAAEARSQQERAMEQARIQQQRAMEATSHQAAAQTNAVPSTVTRQDNATGAENPKYFVYSAIALGLCGLLGMIVGRTI